MSLKTRIDELFNGKPGLKNAQLAKAIACSRATVTDWRNGKTSEINGVMAHKVADYFGVNAKWVQTGEGPKDRIVGQISIQEDDDVFNVEPGPDKRGNVPLISWVQAGSFCEAIDNFQPGDAEQWLPCFVSHSGSTFALRVRGDSMTNSIPGQISYPEGTIIYVDPYVPAASGKRVVARLEGSKEVTFKELRIEDGVWYLKPLNTHYKMIEVPDDVHICGVVIGSWQGE